MFTPTTIGFAAFGALIVWRHRAHSIGWLFVAVAFFFSLCHNLAQNYAVYALAVDPGSLPGGNGRVLVRVERSRHDLRRRHAAPAAALPGRQAAHAALAAARVGGGRRGGARRAAGRARVRRRAAAPGGAQPDRGLRGVGTAIDVAQAATVPLTIAALVGGVASMVLRFRRSAGVERQQMKWVVAGVVIWSWSLRASLAVAGGRGLEDANAIPFVALDRALPGRDGARHPALSPVRHRPGDPADARLHVSHRDARRRVPRRDRASRLALALGHRAVGRGRRDGDDARRGARVPAAAPPDPAGDRPPLLAPHGRRRDRAARLLGAPARGGRPRRALRGAARRGRADLRAPPRERLGQASDGA